ncbi:MAG: hypothetical protein ACRED9_07060 [Caulobacteraceae bacterium]
MVTLHNEGARLDAKGVSVKSPFSLTERSGALGWSDVSQVRLAKRGVRRVIWRLELTGTGETLDLPVQRLRRDKVAPYVNYVLAKRRRARSGGRRGHKSSMGGGPRFAGLQQRRLGSLNRQPLESRPSLHRRSQGKLALRPARRA